MVIKAEPRHCNWKKTWRSFNDWAYVVGCQDLLNNMYCVQPLSLNISTSASTYDNVLPALRESLHNKAKVTMGTRLSAECASDPGRGILN